MYNELPLPDDIFKYVIQPMLYDKNILFKYFTGDPDTGYPVLKDPWEMPHLSIIRQLKDAVETNKFNTDLFPHPLILSNKDKMTFAKDSVKNLGYNSQLQRKIMHKIFNKIKPKSLTKIIENIEENFISKVRYNKYLLLKQIKDDTDIKPYHFSNDKCLHCNNQLPFYTASIRKNWKRSINDGYNPHLLLKRVCSRKCERNNSNVFLCAACSKPCRPGTDFSLDNIATNFFYILYVNTNTAAATAAQRIYLPFLTSFGCSKKCYFMLEKFANNLSGNYLLIRTEEDIEGQGFLLNQNIIDELNRRNYIIRPSVVILNPAAPDFEP